MIEKLHHSEVKPQHEMEWNELALVEHANDHEVGRDEARECGEKVLAVLMNETQEAPAQESETLTSRMRANWGNLKASEGVFGPNTMMHPAEYQTIAENMSWEEFAKFGDQAYDLGHQDEDKYRDFLYRKGSELQRQGLFDWRSFVTAVRRYNVAKHLPGVEASEHFYCSMSLDSAMSVLGSGRLSGHAVNVGRDESLQEQGLSNQLLHLSYDEVTPDGGVDLGIDSERGGGPKMVTVVFGKDLIQNDTFDLATKYPTIENIQLDPDKEVLVAQDRAVYNRIRRLNVRDDEEDLRPRMLEMPVMTRADWLRERGQDIVDDSDANSSTEKLIDDAVMKVDKAEVKKFVDGFLEKVDPNTLDTLLQGYKMDGRKASEAAVEYFAQVLGVNSLPIDYYHDKKDRRLGVHTNFGTVKLNEHIMKKNPRRTMNVLAHEMFHEYQQQLKRSYERGELNNNPDLARKAELYGFCEDMHNTLVAHDWSYRGQLIEAEAFGFGDGVERLLKQQRTRQFAQKLRDIFVRK